MLFSIIPVILEFALVAVVLLTRFDWRFAAVTFTAVALYIAFTVGVTEWRMDIRRRANELDSRANSRAIDSLLNYETVKYFNNEEFEARRYDENLRNYEGAAVRTEASLGMLNIGQSLIIAAAVTTLMILAAQGVVDEVAHARRPRAGERAPHPALHPAQPAGQVYRNIKQALTDMDRMFRLLAENREIEDRPEPWSCRRAPRRCASSTSISATSRSGRSCSTSPSRYPPAARWPWSARAARASPRWRGCSTASTTSAAGASR